MATTYSVVKKLSFGNARMHVVDVSFTATQYSSGGITLAAADFVSLMGPGRTVSDIVGFWSELNGTGQELFLDRVNSKVQIFLGSTEATATISSTTTTTSRAFVLYGVANG